MSRISGESTRGEGNLQRFAPASGGETAPKQAKDTVGRQRASGRHIPKGQGLEGFGQGS